MLNDDIICHNFILFNTIRCHLKLYVHENMLTFLFGQVIQFPERLLRDMPMRSVFLFRGIAVSNEPLLRCYRTTLKSTIEDSLSLH